MMPKFFFLFLSLTTSIFCSSSTSIKSLYNSLDPYSLTQYMAFYELYPETEEGKKALAHAWKLLSHGQNLKTLPQILLPKFDIQAIVSLITRQPFDPPVKLSETQLLIIHKLGSHFTNRNLKGANVWTKEGVLALPPEEIDLCRGLLIEQFADSENFREDILQYEASLDLMALQIFARLPENARPEQKIQEINRFIFQEMQFRFPPHSLYAKDIDLYTFLPSVLDSRQGVCLGVSILYLCLAQRLGLSLEIITPPGHIYVRFSDKNKITNIETTARGINVPSELYLGINTRKLQMRNIKEVIGMAFVNQASVYWQRGEYETCVKLYEKALPYLLDDYLIKMFLGLNYLFVNRCEEGKLLLQPLLNYTFDFAVAPESIPTDYLQGNIDIEGLKGIFLPVDETRESILEKQKELKKILQCFPRFRAGVLQLAVTYLQLARSGEALETLERYHQIDPNDPTVEYYLAIVCLERLDYNLAWKYLEKAEKITQKKEHKPKALRELRNRLRMLCPQSTKSVHEYLNKRPSS